ncbi:LGFP repeat-containing protein [Kineococcus rhizosphaerae]|uniref:LGFP repeat-containing protein n=1 Tax=Kineococcus rhizosphaerae TaxID=559628 RepID=UPI000D051428|nr:hypothetical protein [Kineococcus rhizosphaerae]
MRFLRGIAAAGAAALALSIAPSATAAPTQLLATSYPVTGSFGDLWRSSGAENGFLRQPTSGEVPIRGGVFQNFQGGTLYWTPTTGAHSVSGDFLRFYAGQGYENGFLGYPLTQEVPIRNGVFQVFQGGVLYWSPDVGAHSVSGSFRELYGQFGYENGELGYPRSQELRSRAGGVYQQYQGGVMYWSPEEAESGPHVVRSAILIEYGQAGWENGCLGYPLTSQYSYEGYSTVQEFQGGMIWAPPGEEPFVDLWPDESGYRMSGLYPRC